MGDETGPKAVELRNPFNSKKEGVGSDFQFWTNDKKVSVKTHSANALPFWVSADRILMENIRTDKSTSFNYMKYLLDKKDI